MTILSIDFETRSAVELKRAGVHRYAADPSTGLWCFAWALDDAEPEVWWRGDPLSPAFLAACADPTVLFRAFNAQFERTIWRDVATPQHGFPPLAMERWHCTMAEAMAMGLPRSLENVARALKVPQQKDTEAGKVLGRMMKPVGRTPTGGYLWNEDADDHALMRRYVAQDVRAERSVAKVLRRLDASERAVYLHDQTINDRGVMIDRPLVQSALTLALHGAKDVNARLSVATGGDIQKVTQVGALTFWLREQGIDVENLKKHSITALLEQDLPPAAHEALLLRAEGAKASVAKLKSMLECVGDDGIVRGLLAYHGAATGRWAGRLVQPQNFPRGTIKNVEQFLPLIAREDYSTLDMLDNPLAIISSALRSMLRARPGHVFVSGDYSAIEARITAWLAGQDDLVAMFAAGQDVYKATASVLFGVPIAEVTHHQRQVAKAIVLGCGFGMGPETFVTQAWQTYGVRLTPEQGVEYVAFYRNTYPLVQQYWWHLGDCVLRAVKHPETPVTTRDGRVTFLCRSRFLWLILPSGRPLCYHQPEVILRTLPERVTLVNGVEVRKPARTVESVRVYSESGYSKKWEAVHLYGGLLTENIVQAIARDIMVEGMQRVEPTHPIVMTVHDEVVSERPEADPQLETFLTQLQQVPAWAPGLPITAEGWVGPRYRK